MKAIFKTFESGAGDCVFLVLKDEESGESYHLMVDCNVLTSEIKAFIRDDLQKRIDTIIITHIDSDHIKGITKLLRLPEFADLKIGQFLFNCFQPQGEELIRISDDLRTKFDAVGNLLPPTVDSYIQKTNGMDAASLVSELNRHPLWKAVWRKEPILAGDVIGLGDNEKWGRLSFLSPTQESLDALFKEVKLEYARRLSAAPPNGVFEDQDKYFELMLRLSELRSRPSLNRKTSGISITRDVLDRFAKTDADENNVTIANKASLAFVWEGRNSNKRILMLGDAVSSQILAGLRSFGAESLCFEAIKVSHHGSKNNTSIALMENVNSAHYFITGGKEGEGPHLETFAKIALGALPDGVEKRELHYNHSKGVSLWESLKDVQAKHVLDQFSITLTTDNTYEFEY